LTKYKEGNEKTDGAPEEEIYEGNWVQGSLGEITQ